MARKATRKSGKQTAGKSIQAPKFPADRLPPELIHMVFMYLEPTEVAAFRWAGQVVAQVGLQFLVPTVYLRLNEESYDRVFAIAEHPVVSKYVISLEYETGGLECLEREKFERSIVRTRVTPQPNGFSERPHKSASARAWRAYNRESASSLISLNKRQTIQRFNRAWFMYETSQTSQERVVQANFFHEKIAEAMKRFQNLQTISAHAGSLHERYNPQIKRLLPTCFFWSLNGTHLSNADATTSVLLGVSSAGLPIRSFYCHHFMWQQIFSQDEKILAALKRSVFHLKVMTLTLVSPEATDGLDNSVAKHLETGLAMELITSTPELESLTLSSRYMVITAPELKLKNMVGNFHWSYLKAFSLYGLASREDDLVRFCKRHTHTLRHLSLRDMLLYQGSWVETFHGIRRAFRLGQQLNTCEIAGFFLQPENPATLRDAIFRVGSEYILSTDIGDITIEEYLQVIGIRGIL